MVQTNLVLFLTLFKSWRRTYQQSVLTLQLNVLTFAPMLKTVNILNKRARFDYEIIETYNAGIVLTGTEIKSIRLGKAQITDSFCEFNEDGELFAINTSIEEYAFGNQFNHRARSERKLLLNKRELKNLARSVETKGLTIIPLRCSPTKKAWPNLKLACVKEKKRTTNANRSRSKTPSAISIASRKNFAK